MPTQTDTPEFWIVAVPAAGGTRGSTTKLGITLDRSKPSNTVAGPFSTHAKAATALQNANTFHLPSGIARTLKDAANVANIFENPPAAAAGVAGGISHVSHIIQGWFGSLGGMIASGIESGVIQTFKDLWDVILGPVEVILGFIIAAFVLVVYFKDDIVAGFKMLGQLAGTAAMVAA